MLVGLLLRHYKNYGNLRFIPLLDTPDYKFSIIIGNNGVGKSAILEAINVVFNHSRIWNVTQEEKKTESYICLLFLVPKSMVVGKPKTDIELVSSYLWSDDSDKNANVVGNESLKQFIDFKNGLKKEYEKTHYFVMVGSQYDIQGAFFGSFNKSIHSLLGETDEEQIDRASKQKDYILSLYSYVYIPVEESPTNLLQLQNSTMQKLLNKDILQEIEKLLTQKKNGESIVSQINANLNAFITEVNDVFSGLDSNYSYAPESGNKKNLTAKDIRTKVIEAFFPLRALKVNNRRVDHLSSGEQRRAIIDVSYSTLMANRDRKTEREIILAIDEPEISLHISNCFDQFSRLEELSKRGVQVIITTHWYGYLPIAQNGNMHHLEMKDNQTGITSFSLYNLLENRKAYPDDVELKSIFDLASSLIAYMRKFKGQKWIICEGSDDKLYLESMLKNYEGYRIIPLGGCSMVVKLYQILYGFMTEKSESADADLLFLIDTDIQRIPINEPSVQNKSKNTIILRRLQIVDGEIKLLNPASGGTYNQTEMEDCLNPRVYYESVGLSIQNKGEESLKEIWNGFEFVEESKRSNLRGDNACIKPKDVKWLEKKNQIIEFAENNNNKYEIAQQYMMLCEKTNIEHPLAELIAKELELIDKGGTALQTKVQPIAGN